MTTGRINQVTILCPTPVRTRRSSGAGNRLTTVELLTRKQALERETKCLGDLRERRPEGTKLIAHIHLPRLNSFKQLPQRSAVVRITRTLRPDHCMVASGEGWLTSVTSLRTDTEADIPSNDWSLEL